MIRKPTRMAMSIMAVFLITATALPLMRKEAWWIRVFDFPRMQIAILSMLVFAAYILLIKKKATLEKLLLALLALAVAYQTSTIYPYTQLAPVQVLKNTETDPDVRFSLLISNVLMTNRNVARYLEIIRTANPDIILVAEPDRWWEKQLRPLEASYPHTVKYPLSNTYGMLLYSRLPLINPEVGFLVEPDIPSIHTFIRLKSGTVAELYFLHPEPPHPVKSPDTEERDAELLIVAKRVNVSKRPLVVAGDLNDVAWSRTTRLFQEISGLLDPRIGRGVYNTYNAKYPLLRFPLDHVFHSDHFRLARLERLGYFDSDHFPIYIALSYEPAGKREQGIPQPDSKSKSEAEKKIRKVK